MWLLTAVGGDDRLQVGSRRTDSRGVSRNTRWQHSQAWEAAQQPAVAASGRSDSQTQTLSLHQHQHQRQQRAAPAAAVAR
ncbi:hypothetical protein CCHR01_15600 [Colletotrichum chrysophilum]|uniref:Uncharacterized protein n=1 Tax=Colletotrichum chrysophilum TaxID=1836956 RepID=A0AAD9E8K1_9PEZI|nr:hypothetical protein CCHR01_15600 [Colletotrichum chrysophilum]